MLLTAVTLLLQVASARPDAPGRAANVDMLREARSAQTRFEGIRRMHLPRRGFGSSGRRCDARVGRFCYWYDSIPSTVVPEPKRIAAERAKLLAFLDSASTGNPSDPWLVGQQVRYLIEAGQPDSAAVRAKTCASDGWWCAALLGLALHVGQRYDSADAAFSTAMQRMPAAQRCAWMDVSLLLEGRLATEISRASCEDRARLANRLWTLGQPLWSTAGADLRTEHFARLTMAAILERSANAHGTSWGDDSRELLLRYGWSEWFTRRDPDPGDYYAWPSITGHDREPSYFFFPDAQSARTTPRIVPSTWRLRDPMARSRYAPRHVKRLSELSHQLVRLPRGDSTLVAVAYRVRDTALIRDSLAAALSAYDNGTVRVEKRTRDTVSLVVRRDTLIVSVEVRGKRSTHAERARYTIDPLPCRGAWCLSDLLLFDARRVTEPDVAGALASAHTDSTISAGGPLGVLWEMQGVAGTEPMWLSLAVEPLHDAVVRRVARRLRLVRPRDAVRLRWRAPLRSALQTQSTIVRLSPTARGRYRVLLTVEPVNGPAVSASRDIEVRP